MSIQSNLIMKANKCLFRIAVFLLLLIPLFWLSATPLHAQSGKQISSVQISITNIDYSNGLQPNISLAAGGNNYEIIQICEEDDFDEDYFDREFAEISKYQIFIIELQAESGYYFSRTKITLKGADAHCTATYYTNNNESLFLKCEFRDLSSWQEEIESAEWLQSGQIVWTPISDAVFYEVRLFYEDDALGNLYITQGTQYDVSPLMLKPGDYYYKVRPCRADGSYGYTISSEMYSIGSEDATQFKSRYEIPENEQERQEKGKYPGWQQDSGGWWYRNNDGMYEQDNWQQIDGIWYYFNGNGYMVYDQWITWQGVNYYMTQDGSLQ